MIQIAVVEDDPHYRKTITDYLERYESESKTKMNISVYVDGEDIIKDYKQHIDIILMDIKMFSMDGISAAEEIRKVDSEVVIIFITNTPQFAMEGYKVDALDYVLKPITYFAFSQRIDRAISRMEKRVKEYITIKVKSGIRKIDLSKIIYIEVQDHDVTFKTVDGDFTTKDSLKNIEESLNSRAFFRCHKWILVNLGFIDSVQNNEIVIENNKIQVSRARKKELLDALNIYLHEVSK